MGKFVFHMLPTFTTAHPIGQLQITETRYRWFDFVIIIVNRVFKVQNIADNP